MSYVVELFIFALRGIQQLIWENEVSDVPAPVETKQTALPEIPIDPGARHGHPRNDQFTVNRNDDPFWFRERHSEGHEAKMHLDGDGIDTTSSYDRIVAFLQFGESEAQLSRLNRQLDFMASWNDPVEFFAF